jgi:hypothetical protein
MSDPLAGLFAPTADPTPVTRRAPLRQVTPPSVGARHFIVAKGPVSVCIREIDPARHPVQVANGTLNRADAWIRAQRYASPAPAALFKGNKHGKPIFFQALDGSRIRVETTQTTSKE